MLNKIFITKGKSKDTFDPLTTKVLSSGFDKPDFERDRNMKLLENLFSLKLDQNYIDKSSLLLYNSKKTRNYPQKRKYLRKTVYNYDQNNNLYITFPKFNSVERPLKKNSKTIEMQGINSYFITDKNDFEDQNLEELRKKINQEINDENLNFKTISNNEDIEKESEEIEKKGKKLYKLLKTKYDEFDNNTLPIIENSNNRERLSMIKRINDIDPILGQKFLENRAKILTKRQQSNLFYLSELEVFDSMNKLNAKKEILNWYKNKGVKKNKLLIKDLFHYDKEKWNKINHERNFNENEAKINEINEKNRKKLGHLKGIIDKLENEKLKTESDVNETISNINYFLKKNASPLTLQNIQEKSLRSSKIRKK